ncbi:MAG TPA: type II toxin-antitoxin system VapB family antitoxin [Syntrophales bacterium]|nr:type II toxin-antitoxin system VapB family antitoxin [Syntrophales bacterium]
MKGPVSFMRLDKPFLHGVFMYTQGGVLMRTNVLLDDRLVEEALMLSKMRTKKEVIHEALKEFVENRRRLNLLDLSGKINFADGYDYKSLREGR